MKPEPRLRPSDNGDMTSVREQSSTQGPRDISLPGSQTSRHYARKSGIFPAVPGFHTSCSRSTRTRRSQHLQHSPDSVESQLRQSENVICHYSKKQIFESNVKIPLSLYPECTFRQIFIPTFLFMQDYYLPKDFDDFKEN